MLPERAWNCPGNRVGDQLAAVSSAGWGINLPRRGWESTRSGGCRIRVRTARMREPPMTTMARGFWVWAPIPFESAAGGGPEGGTRAVLSTGREGFSAGAGGPTSMDFAFTHLPCATGEQ